MSRTQHTPGVRISSPGRDTEKNTSRTANAAERTKGRPGSGNPAPLSGNGKKTSAQGGRKAAKASSRNKTKKAGSKKRK